MGPQHLPHCSSWVLAGVRHSVSDSRSDVNFPLERKEKQIHPSGWSLCLHVDSEGESPGQAPESQD